MALDGLFLHLLKNEIYEAALGSRVEKVHQPAKNELVLTMRSRSGAFRLLLSCSGNAPRIHFTANAPENPQNPPMLCMLLRKHLTGAILEDITQPELERILFLRFNAANELGDRVSRTLVIEIMANHSNIILIDENSFIIDSVKRVDSLQSSVREVLPSLPYELPPAQDKLDIFDCENAAIIEKIAQCGGKNLSGALLSSLQGFSPLLCREVAYRAFGDDIALDSIKNIAPLEAVLDEIRDIVRSNKVSPCLVNGADGKLLDYSFLPVTQYGNIAECHEFDTLSELLDSFYYERERLARTKSRAEGFFRFVSNMIERTSRKINNQRAELKQSENREEKRIFAELINANLYKLEKGSLFYTLENYYDNNKEIKISVKPHLTPSQNAQRYYKEYRKAQTAELILAKQIEAGEEELAYFLTVEDALSRASTERELSEIRQELQIGGYLKKGGYLKNGKQIKNPPPMPPMEFDAPCDCRVFVGRNNVQNDRLSFKTAGKNDFWFHAQKMPGSHVILQFDGDEPPDEAVEYAASLAAYFSSGREAPTVPIDYTQVKNLKKPSGSKPGFVIYHVYYSMLAKPIKPEGI